MKRAREDRAWEPGEAIFSDDTASDLREEYRDLIGDGLSGPAATDRLLEEWRSSLLDPDQAPAFWLALAATQWACVRLEERVQREALEIIANGSDLRRWAENPKLAAKRQAVLAKLEAKLRSPQPPVKRISKRFLDHCEWEVGEVIGYRLRSERWVLFRVIHYHTDKGGTAPIFELLDWVGDEIPPIDMMKDLPVRVGYRGYPGYERFMIGRLRERELPVDRVRRLGIKLEPAQKPQPARVSWPVNIFIWRSLDTSLEQVFQLT